MGRTAKPPAPKPPTTVEGLDKRVEAAAKALADAAEADDEQDIEALKRRLKATQRYYHLRAVWLSLQGLEDDAAKASTAALRAEEQLAKAHKLDLVTRVERLESQVGQSRSAGKGVRALHEKKTRRKPPGADPRA